MSTSVTLGGITFNATDGDGVEWVLRRDPEGWDSPPVRSSTYSKHGGGDVQTNAEFEGRPVALVDGLIIAPTNTLLWQKRNELAAACADLLPGNPGTLVVVEPATSKQLTVYSSGRKPVLLREQTPTIAEFEVRLFAPDPLKYATSTTAISGAANYTNAGNVASQNIVLALSAGSTLTNTTDGSKAIVTTGTGTLDINVLTRTVTKAGVNAYDQIASTTEWFSLLPGSNTLTLDVGTVTGTFRSAWL